MDINFHEKVLQYCREVDTDAVYQEETCELILPESAPELQRVIECSGTVLMKRKDTDAGTVTVSGEIKAVLLYVSEEAEGLQRAEQSIHFAVKKDIPGLLPEHGVQYRGWIRKIDARQLGNRKALLRANIGSSFTALLPAQITIREPSDPPKQLQTLQKTYDILLPSMYGEKELQMNEECTLPESAAGICEILKSSAAFRVSECKTVGDKAVFKGDVLLHVLYSAETGTVHTYSAELPFSQYAELDGEAEDGDVHLTVQLCTLDVDTDGQPDSKRLLVSVTALAQMVVSINHRLTLTEDAYVTKGALETEWEELNLRARLDVQNATVSTEIAIPAAARQVLGAQIYADMPVVRRNGAAVKAAMPLTASIIYLDKDGELQGKEARSEIVTETAAAESAVCRAEASVPDQPISLASYDTVTLRVTAQMQLQSDMGSLMKTLKTAKLVQQEEKAAFRPSLIAKRVTDASVWEIAKSCRSTVEAICEANGLSSGTAQEGAILLIPMQ